MSRWVSVYGRCAIRPKPVGFQVRQVVGLPKLLVLAALRTYKTANAKTDDGEEYADGAFLISLKNLGEYGRDRDEV